MTADTEPQAPKKRTRAPSPRTAARLGAVQAIYQIAQSGQRVAEVVEEFIQHRLGHEIEGDQYAESDLDLFRDLVTGTQARLADIDPAVTRALPAGWPFERLEAVMRAILRAGAYELLVRMDVPTAVVINEYVNVAHGFYGGKEPAFVNGVLDQVARTARA